MKPLIFISFLFFIGCSTTRNTSLILNDSLIGEYLLTKVSRGQTMYELNIIVLEISKKGSRYFVCDGKKENNKISYHHDWKYELLLKENNILSHKYGVFEMRLKRTGDDLQGDADIAQGDGKVGLYFTKIK